MTRLDRPDMATLADWLEGRLHPEAADRVASAVAANAELGADVAWLRRLFASATDLPLELPPPFVADRLMAAYDNYLTGKGARARPALQLRATLIFDSRHDLARAGVRGDSIDDAFHLAYSVATAVDDGDPDAYIVDVVIDATPLNSGSVRLSGQVLSASADPGPFRDVRAFTAGDEGLCAVAGSSIGPLGRFAFDEVSTTASELHIHAEAVTIVAPLELQHGR